MGLNPVALPDIPAIRRSISQVSALRRLPSFSVFGRLSAGRAGSEPVKNVLLVGGGKIGVAITEFLAQSGDYKVTVADRDPASLGRMPAADNVILREIDILSR